MGGGGGGGLGFSPEGCGGMLPPINLHTLRLILGGGGGGGGGGGKKARNY